MLNEFEAKNIHRASRYLQGKLNIFKKIERREILVDPVFVVEPKKESFLQRLVHTLFKS
jgi:hypothetical protein